MAQVNPDRTVYIYGLYTESDSSLMYEGNECVEKWVSLSNLYRKVTEPSTS